MSTMIKNTVVAAAIGLALVACGKKEDAPAGAASGTATLTGAVAKIGSCNKLANVGKCSEYDLSKDTLGLDKSGCEATDGKWQTTACPTDKAFANCTTAESKIVYYAGTTAPGSLLTMDEEFSKLDCDMMSGKLVVTAKIPTAAAAASDKPAGAGGAGGAGAGKKAAAAPAKPKK